MKKGWKTRKDEKLWRIKLPPLFGLIFSSPTLMTSSLPQCLPWQVFLLTWGFSNCAVTSSWYCGFGNFHNNIANRISLIVRICSKLNITAIVTTINPLILLTQAFLLSQHSTRWIPQAHDPNELNLPWFSHKTSGKHEQDLATHHYRFDKSPEGMLQIKAFFIDIFLFLCTKHNQLFR